MDQAGFASQAYPWGYFTGQSKYNRSVLGWAGHGAGRRSVRDTLESVTLHSVESVVSSVEISTVTGGNFELPIKDYVSLPRVNFPDNCYTLDLSDNKDIQTSGISQLFINLKAGTDISIEGSSQSCNRQLKAQTFYSSGDMITQLKAGEGRQYMVQIKQKVVMEGIGDCRNYPNPHFQTYRWAPDLSVT